MNACACVCVHFASSMMDASCKNERSCIKTATILNFKLFFCNTSVRQCSDSITYSCHCHPAHIVSHVAAFKLSHFSLMIMLYIFHIHHFSQYWWLQNYYSIYAAHTVLLFVFLQKRMNKLHDWNLCWYKNDSHLFFKCRRWTKWVAY